MVGALLHYLKSRELFMSLYIIYICKLLRHKNPFILLLHLKSGLQTLVYAGSYISRVMDKLDLSAVMTYELSPLFAYGIGHYYYSTISLYRAYKGKTYSLISAGRLYDNAVFIDKSFLFRLFDHIEGGTGLDGSSHIKSLEFYKHIGAVLIGHTVQSYQRSLPYSLQNIITYHLHLPFLFRLS